jgi:hypothetical protein
VVIGGGQFAGKSECGGRSLMGGQGGFDTLKGIDGLILSDE